jgi:four helix bundle protein
MTEKERFVTQLKARTRQFAVEVIAFCETLKRNKSSDVISYQLVKSATSTGANYRAACRARSKSEFYSKICIVVEEADETEYWLELIKEANLSKDMDKLSQLADEANQITKIMTRTKNSIYKS